MEPIFKIVQRRQPFSIYSAVHEKKYFYEIWHYHPQLEIVSIVKGNGSLVIGNTIRYFKPGDIVLIGNKLPHVWKSDLEYYNEENNLTCKAKVIQFDEDFLGDQFFNVFEFQPIKELLLTAQDGLFLEGETRKVIQKLMNKIIKEESGFNRIMILLEILNHIASTKEYLVLNETNFNQNFHKSNPERLNDVFKYTLEHFGTDIKLADLANVSNMSVSNFCKFFKKHTNKTYNQFLTEIRIGNTCRELINSTKSIQEIAWECGFNNLSNFNRNFKLVKETTPKRYRSKFKKIVEENLQAQ